MSGYFDASADFFFSGSDNKSGDTSLTRWIERVFADPMPLTHRISPDIFNAENLTTQQETALYLDWQTRDTELGYRLIERHREELMQSSESFRNALAKKRKQVTFTRTRLEALQKINATELNPSLKHPQHIFGQLETEVRTAQEDLQVLRYYVANLAILDIFLKPVIGGASNESQFLSEQRMRLLGQSWRGWMRLQSFAKSFSNYHFPLPVNETASAPMLTGFVVTVSEGVINPLKTDILITQEVAAYLHHSLQAIRVLSIEVEGFFCAEERPKLKDNPWSKLMFLLRAITELFYFCWFEMPIASNNLIVDIDEPSKFWFYQAQTQQWQPTASEGLNLKLKREAATLANFIVNTPSLLTWRTPTDINISALITPQCQRGLQPYHSVGLANLELNATKHTHKFQSGYNLAGKIIEQVVNADSNLSEAFNSPLGGPLETLTAMALLDYQAFTLLPKKEAIPENELLQYLAQFWKSMGKRRPMALLGERYARTVGAKFKEIGEPSPERVSQMSIQLSAVLSRTATIFGDQRKSTSQELLGAVALADQIRLAELVNSTWKFIEEVANIINFAEEGVALASIINSLPAKLAEHETNIGKRFSTKWVTAKQPIWQVLSASVPIVWDFWAKLAENQPWTASLSQLAPDDAVVALLSLCADNSRLLAILESSSQITLERLATDAETAGNIVLAAFQRYQYSAAVIELMRYYYDTEISHDGWIAFTSSLKLYLQQLQGDLQKFGATAQIDILTNITKQLETNYPTPVITRRTAKKAVSIGLRIVDAMSLKPAILDKNDIEAVETIINNLIGQQALDSSLFLKLVASLQMPDNKAHIQFLAKHADFLKQRFPNNRFRQLFFNMPSVTQTITSYLAGLGLEANTSALTSEIVFQLEEYLTQLDVFHHYLKNILSETSACPREDLSEIQALVQNFRANLILFQVFDQTFFFIVRERVSNTLERVQEFLQSLAVGQLADWKPEYLILGTVGIYKNEQGLVIGSSEVPLDPIFTDPSSTLAERMMMTYLRNKYQLILSLLKRELPEMQMQVQIG